MAEVVISQDWLNTLTGYLNDLTNEAAERAEAAALYFHQQVQEKARHTPGWEALADQITMWSEDGMLHIGVSNEQYTSEAWVLEYGDEHNAPNPLFRTLSEQVAQTNEFAQTAVSARYSEEVP